MENFKYKLYFINYMKTIALQEKTFEMLEEMKKKEKVKSFDSLLLEMIRKKEKIPESMLGSLKGKTKSFTKKERKEMWRDHEL